MQAQFIVVEGLEGAGKSTAIDWIKSQLKTAGITEIITTREPGGTPLAEKIRHLVKDHFSPEPIFPETELLLMYASRVQCVNHVVKPALSQGSWVISDRHELSTRAYQGGGRQLPEALIESIYQAVLHGFQPNFTLYLDIDPVLGLQRANQRGVLDRIERENLAFFERTRARYLELASGDPHIVTIDAMQDIPSVRQAITKALKHRYPNLSFSHE
jgi:dTMP kinase